MAQHVRTHTHTHERKKEKKKASKKEKKLQGLRIQQALSAFPPLGLRTEQDLYVRLIDSMSKQVSQPRGCSGLSSLSEHPCPRPRLPMPFIPTSLAPPAPSTAHRKRLCGFCPLDMKRTVLVQRLCLGFCYQGSSVDGDSGSRGLLGRKGNALGRGRGSRAAQGRGWGMLSKGAASASTGRPRAGMAQALRQGGQGSVPWIS